MMLKALRPVVLDGRMTDGWSNAEDIKGNDYGLIKALLWDLLVGSEETI
jgi:hypothetical protein